jgi:hypothetical protein
LPIRNHRVIEVTPDKQIVFTQGQLNVPGNGVNMLDGPYDAKVVGDFNGLTSPKDTSEDEVGDDQEVGNDQSGTD